MSSSRAHPSSETAVLLKQAGAALGVRDFSAAVRACDAALGLKPDLFDAWLLKGAATHALGQLKDAEAAFEHACRIKPDHARCHYNLGVVKEGLVDFAGAESAYRKALAIQPAFPEALGNLGNVLKAMGKDDDARRCYEQALVLNPGYVAAYNNLGHLAQLRGDGDEAERQYREALRLSPGFMQAWLNLSALQLETGCIDDAAQSAERAKQLAPDSASALVNAGMVEESRGNLRLAIEHYRRAIQFAPSLPKAHNNLAYALLASGDFNDAWREYRWRHALLRRNVDAPWQDLPVVPDFSAAPVPRSIVLRAEQGVGDIIFFLRFASRLKAKGPRLAFWGEARLHDMIERTRLFDEMIAPQNLPRGDDVVVAVGDLPLSLGVELEPQSLALVAETKRVALMAERLKAAGPPPYIGLTWRAGLASGVGKRRLHKQIPLDRLAACIAGMRGTFISVQRLPEPGETATLAQLAGCKVHDWSSVNDDLEETLALMSLLDDYIAVSNTNVHLRDGTGRSARILVPHPPEWRWMSEGDASPWFPGFDVYRQAASGEWDQAVKRLKSDLERDFG